MNGALCVNGNQSYSCTCIGDFQGNLCEIDKIQCNLERCSGHGKCVFHEDKEDTVNIQCACETGWQGKLLYKINLLLSKRDTIFIFTIF